MTPSLALGICALTQQIRVASRARQPLILARMQSRAVADMMVRWASPMPSCVSIRSICQRAAAPSTHACRGRQLPDRRRPVFESAHMALPARLIRKRFFSYDVPASKPSKSDQSHSPPVSDQNASAATSSQHEPQKLSEDILTIPNVLTMARLFSTPVLGWLILQDEMQYALALLAASAVTDALDGYLARRYQSATVFGSIADPAADKALMTVMVGALAWRGLIPLPLVLLILGRDIGLVLSAFVVRWQSLPEPKTIARYWDPRLPSAKVQPTQISKYNTLLQIILVGICTLLASMNESWTEWWSTRRGLWSDEGSEDQYAHKGKAIIQKEAMESAGHSAPSKQRSPPTVRQDRDQDIGDYAKKSWHAFMIVVAATTVWSGASYLFGTGAIRYVGRMARERKEIVESLKPGLRHRRGPDKDRR